MVNILLSYNLKYEHLKEYIKPSDKVVVIPFAFRDHDVPDVKAFNEMNSKDSKYYKYTVECFGQFGVDSSNITYLNYFTDSKGYMKDMIATADILFIPGGLPHRAVERIIELGLFDVIRAFDKTVIGVSAGALIQLEQYLCTPDKDYSELVFYKGFGLIDSDFYIHVHHDINNIGEIEVLQTIAAEQNKIIYGLDNDSCIIVQGEKVILKGDINIIS